MADERPHRTGPMVGPQTMLTVAGKPFRCGCMCNVFTVVIPGVYRCNSCEWDYKEVPEDKAKEPANG